VATESILGTAAADSLSATSTGADSITSNLSGDFIIEGLQGNDTIKVPGTASNYTIQGGAGADTILVSSDVSNVNMIQGGAGNDTITFSKKLSATSVYGGQGADSIRLSGSATGKIAGSDGNDTLDFDGKVSGSVIRGDGDDDVLTFASRFDSSTVYGGKGEDSFLLSNIVDTAKVFGDDGDDTINIAATTTFDKSTIHGSAGEDSIGIAAGATGTSSFYGGKGEDTILLTSTAKFTVSGDKDADVIDVAGVSLGATAYGGDGTDSITNTGNGKTVFFGGAGKDTIKGGTGANKLYGGKDADSLIGGAGGKDTIYGDAGNDTITLDSTATSAIYGGEGADSLLASGDATGAHTIVGGAGADTINVGDQGAAALADAAVLTYASFGEFVTGGALVDSISGTDTDFVKAEVTGGLAVTVTTDFSRFNFATRAAGTVNEGLVLQTAKATTAASSVVLSQAAANKIGVVDLSAGTTGASTIDFSANTSDLDTLLTGGKGNDTINGGAGADSINGGAGADSITSGAENDTINGGTGIDIINLGAGTSQINTPGTQLAADRDNVTNFTVGTDVIGLDLAFTTLGTALGLGAVLEDEAIAAANANGDAYDLDGLLTKTTATVDLVTLDTSTLTNVANADLDAATDGTELLKSLVALGAGKTADALTVTGGSKFYIAADDGTDGYLYAVNDANGDSEAVASEITLVGDFGSAATLGDIATGQTLMI
jgi:Ca2+-binding RTX toxin-like protein